MFCYRCPNSRTDKGLIFVFWCLMSWTCRTVKVKWCDHRSNIRVTGLVRKNIVEPVCKLVLEKCILILQYLTAVFWIFLVNEHLRLDKNSLFIRTSWIHRCTYIHSYRSLTRSWYMGRLSGSWYLYLDITRFHVHYNEIYDRLSVCSITENGISRFCYTMGRHIIFACNVINYARFNARPGRIC